jgi:hypothetical protein
MESNNIGRFYSRKNGWNNGIIVKSFYSELIIKLPCYNLDDKDGKFIYKYIEKNNIINEYIELYRLSKLYNNWFFYYGEAIDIYSQESL